MELNSLCKREYQRRLRLHRFYSALANVILALGGGLFILSVGTGMFTPDGSLSASHVRAIALFLVMGSCCVLSYLVMATFIEEPEYDIRPGSCSCTVCRVGRAG